MKKLFFAIPLLSLLLANTGCQILDDDDINFNPAQAITVPSQVQDFVATNYNGFVIDHAHLDDLCDDVPVYEVELEDGPGPDIDLYFDMDWNFLFQATDIANAALPSAVTASIQSQYPGYTIEQGSSERFDFPDGSVQYYVELESNSNNDLEVVLKADGSIVCTDTSSNDDDDDDDDDNNGSGNNGNNGQSVNIPSATLDFINGNYPGFQVQGAHTEDLCDDVPVYEVELEDGPGPDIDLYFDLNWNYLFQATDIANAALPSAVTAAIQSQFPGYTIETGQSERFDFPDGSVQYYVELESNSDDDLEVVLKADGSIVCTDTSSNDDDDDDDDDNNGNGNNGNNGQSVNIPSATLDFINGNYPGFQVQGAHTEDLCDDVPVYEVELEDGPGPDIDLYFDLNWNYLFQATDIANAALPSAVTASIQSQFPGYTIEQGQSERFDFPDGSVQYYVELESNSDDDLEVVLKADGSIVCTDED